jgi:hypothetical protein
LVELPDVVPPDDDAPVVPEVVEPLLASLELGDVDVEPRSLVGPLLAPEDDVPVVGAVTLPLAVPVAEPIPDEEPETVPLALGVLPELPEEVEPLGVDDAHAARVKAHTTGMIHLFIETSFVFSIEIM